MIIQILVHPGAVTTFVILSLLGFIIASVEALSPGTLPKSVSDILSLVIDKYLTWRYPIRSVDGTSDLPTCPYSWPNGQGDIGKFLDGIENSSRWNKLFGTIYRIWSGMNSEIVLTRPEQLQVVFYDSDKHLKAVNNNSGYLMGQLLGQCVGLISPPQWRGVRSVTEVPFRHHASKARIGEIEELVQSHFQLLQNEGNLSHGCIHPAQDLKMLPFWVVCQFFYGLLPFHLTETLKGMTGIREDLMKHIIGGGITRFSFSRYLPTAANSRLMEFKKRWQQFNRLADEHARNHAPNTPIVAMYDAIRKGEISEAQLLQTLDEALYANLDVTTGGLSWNLVYLAAYPHCQRKLRQEIGALTDDFTLEKYLQSHSTYLHACILESSRLKPLAAFSVPQSTPTPRVVDGYLIPAGTSFVVDSYALNIRNPYWGPDNETYRPERFMNRNNTELRYLFWRFGFGPRQCMGKYAADMIIRATLAYLVRNFELSLTVDNWTRDKKTWITHPDFLIGCEALQE